MKKAFRFAAALLVCSGVPASWGYNFVLQYDHLSALQDVSNILSSNTSYSVAFIRTQDEDPLYINEVEIVHGSNWDSNIDLYDEGGILSYNGGIDHYTLGDAITGDAVWVFHQVAYRYGAISSDIAPGMYDFTIVFRGGADASATDSLAELAGKLTVIPRLEVDVTASTTPGSIYAGQSADAFISVTNRMQQDFVSTTWFYYNGGFKNGSSVLSGTFQGDWFDKQIAPSDTLTGIHSRWTASGSSALGIYDGSIGVVGGAYNGDYHYILATPDPKIEVTAVPEPLTVIGLGAGLAGLLVRRRKSSR